MFDYNNDAEEIRRALDFQYFFEEAPYIKKSEVPPWLVRLDKQFEGFLDLPLSEKVKKGKELINQIVEKALERKLTLTQEVYPKIKELSMFYYQKWIKPEVFPAQKKEKEYIAQLKAKIEARKKGVLEIDKRTAEEIIEQNMNEEIENKQRFVKFFDLLHSKEELIKKVKASIREWNQNTFPAGWIFRRTNELLEAIGQHKKDENSEQDKSDIVDLLGIATLAKSLYWNEALVEENLVEIYDELNSILSELEFWPTKEHIELCREEGKEALDDLNFILEDKYSRYKHTRLNFYDKALKIWDAEQMLVRELKPIETIVSLPDKIRENLQKIQNEEFVKKLLDFEKKLKDLQKGSEIKYYSIETLAAAFLKDPRNTLQKGKKTYVKRAFSLPGAPKIKDGVSVSDFITYINEIGYKCSDAWILKYKEKHKG